MAASDPITRELLSWYDRHKRVLPWRALPGAVADPYAVWLSEVMLQQTTVATVKPYFARFLARWPTVTALAEAPPEAVMAAWAGLGYYARARNLHDCAKAVVAVFGGRFPSSERELRSLPGLGEYTAAAMAAIAFGVPAAVVDGNVERVMARLFAVETPLPGAKPMLRGIVASLVPRDRPGDFAQATMDFGATLCTPRSPACTICPLARSCRARAEGTQMLYPKRRPKRAKPRRYGVVAVIERADGATLVRTRPPSGLLGGMAEFIGTAWTDVPPDPDELRPNADLAWMRAGIVEHGFTHFDLRLEVFRGRASSGLEVPGCRWVGPNALAREPLPSLMVKVRTMAGSVVPIASNRSALVSVERPDQQHARNGQQRQPQTFRRPRERNDLAEAHGRRDDAKGDEG